MTKLLEQAWEAVSRLPDTEQDAIATQLLSTLANRQEEAQEPAVWRDDAGVASLAGTPTKVVEIALEMQQGRSVAEIARQHSHLTTAQIETALAYYHAHQAELDADIERRFRLSETLRQQARNQWTRADLQARRTRAAVAEPGE